MKRIYYLVLGLLCLPVLCAPAQQDANRLQVRELFYYLRDAQSGDYTIRHESSPLMYLRSGDIEFGRFQPVLVVRNVGQAVVAEFPIECRIHNQVLGREIYSAGLCVDSAFLFDAANRARVVDAEGREIDISSGTWSGLPPGASAEIRFPPYESNQFLQRPGFNRLSAYIVALHCENQSEQDPVRSDDSVYARFVEVRPQKEFYENGSGFRQDSGAAHFEPDENNWVNFGAEIVDGWEYCFQPPAPQVAERAANAPGTIVHAPLIRLNRLDHAGNDQAAPGGRGGDTLLSNAIDLRGREKPMLVFSVQRGGRAAVTENWAQDWPAAALRGPEPRVIAEGDAHNARAIGDHLVVEFLSPDAEGAEYTVNIPEDAWNRYPVRGGAGIIEGNPAFTLFGAGGSRRGMAEPIVAEARAFDSALTAQEGLRADLYDTGMDRAFQKVYVPIPREYTDPEHPFSTNFRFRFRVEAANNGNANLPDDADDFFLDNIEIVYEKESADVEVTAITLENPYTIINPRLSREIPISVTLSNNSPRAARSFLLDLSIIIGGEEHRFPKTYVNERTTYYHNLKTIPFLPAASTVTATFPSFDATRIFMYPDSVAKSTTHFRTAAITRKRIEDSAPPEDSLGGQFTLRFGDEFAYDTPAVHGQNDVALLAQTSGKGLNCAARPDGAGTFPFGAPNGNAAGELAVKVDVTPNRQDGGTVYGCRVFFGSLNPDSRSVAVRLYEDNNGVPGPQIADGVITRARGADDLRGETLFNEYVTFLFEEPIKVNEGGYWLSIVQLRYEGFELGGSALRTGLLTTDYSEEPQLGIFGVSAHTDPRYKLFHNQPPYRNSSRFMYREALRSWQPFAPDRGNPLYAYGNHAGTVEGIESYKRFTFVPMIRMLTVEPVLVREVRDSCAAAIVRFNINGVDNIVVRNEQNVSTVIHGLDEGWWTPVLRATLIEREQPGILTITATGIYGDTVLNLTIPAQPVATPVVTFESGILTAPAGERYRWYLNGNAISGAANRSYVPTEDGRYTVEVTYPGGCTALSEPLDVVISSVGSVTAYPNPLVIRPNPVTSIAEIRYTLQREAAVKLQILDLHGRVLVHETLPRQSAGGHSYAWDASNVSAGVYLCRLLFAGQVHTARIVVRGDWASPR